MPVGRKTPLINAVSWDAQEFQAYVSSGRVVLSRKLRTEDPNWSFLSESKHCLFFLHAAVRALLGSTKHWVDDRSWCMFLLLKKAPLNSTTWIVGLVPHFEAP